MKAIVLKELGGPEQLQYTEVPIPTIKKGEVLIKVKNAALNRRDVWITYGQYPGMKLPSILGSDGSGVVSEIGEEVSSIQVGDKVVINPSLNWGDDPNHYSVDHHILGMPTDGTYAQYVVVPEENVFKKPTSLTFAEAATIPLGGLTAYRALFTRGNVQKGENVFIPGIGGGVALLALQMAVAKGTNVFVSSSDDEKLEKAMQLGAKGGVNYKKENWVKDVIQQMDGGAEVIIDSIGGSSFHDFIKIARPNGRIVSFGATSGVVKDLVMPRIFFKHLNIMGSTMGNPNEFAKMLDLFEEYKIKPVIDHVFPLEQAIEAQKRMEQGAGIGKIVLEIPQ